jgi:hypothetical protein
MSMRRAGGIQITLSAGVQQYMTDLAAAEGKLRDWGSTARGSMASASSAVVDFGNKLRPILRDAAQSFATMTLAADKSVGVLRSAARDFLEFGASAAIAAKGIALYGAHSNELVNSYRGLRLALSPKRCHLRAAQPAAQQDGEHRSIAQSLLGGYIRSIQERLGLRYR